MKCEHNSPEEPHQVNQVPVPSFHTKLPHCLKAFVCRWTTWKDLFFSFDCQQKVNVTAHESSCSTSANLPRVRLATFQGICKFSFTLAGASPTGPQTVSLELTPSLQLTTPGPSGHNWQFHAHSLSQLISRDKKSWTYAVPAPLRSPLTLIMVMDPVNSPAKSSVGALFPLILKAKYLR